MGWGNIVMIGIAFFLLYLAIRHKFEPLLLLTIAFGMLLTNLPGANLYHTELFAGGHVHWDIFVAKAGLLDYLYLGVKLGIYPCLIFLGVGAMTDFGPLIANPKSFLLGAAAQIGIFVTFLGAYAIGFSPEQSGSIGIIGGADGPTAIYLTSMLAPELLGPIAVAAYSYMALVPVIQPPIMRLLTNKHERAIRMRTLRPVSKTERILFPIIISVVIALLLPSAMPLVGCLMLGNLMKECGVVDRLSKTVQNELMNIVVIFLGLTVGATATAEAFLNFRTLGILVLGVIAFCLGTAGGVLLAKFMNLFSKEENKINPLIGSAGVSAVPMAARVSQIEGQRENPGNYLLMHAMGPNVAGVVGSAVAAGILLSFLGYGNALKERERDFEIHALSFYSGCDSLRNRSASSGIPTAARSRRCVSGLTDRPHVGSAGVDQIDRHPGTDVMHQRSRRIDRQRRSDDDQHIGRLRNPHRMVELGNRLAEKDDMRTQQRPVGGRGIQRLFPPFDRNDQRGIARGAEFPQFAVQMRHTGRTGAFVQVVYILGDDLDVEIRLQSRDGQMSRIGTGRQHLAAAFVVKFNHQPAIARQRLGRTDILDPVIGPQSVGIAEGGQSAVGTHAGSGKDYDFFHLE